MKMWKVDDSENDNGDKTTDNGQFWSEKLTWAFGSGEQKTKINVVHSNLQRLLSISPVPL